MSLSKIDQGVLNILRATARTRKIHVVVAYILTTAVVLSVGFARWYMLGADLKIAPYFIYLGVVMIAALLFDRYSGIYATVISLLVASVVPSVRVPGAIEIHINGSGFVFVLIGFALACTVESLSHLYSHVHAQNNRLQIADERNRILITDINHRVKNHLSSLAGLMNAAKRKMQDEEGRNVLTTASNRMIVLARVYDRLHLDQTDASIRVDARGFIEQLCEDLKETIIGSRDIEIETSIAEIEINTAKAVPIGLLVNEIVTNAVKHAFGDKPGTICVRFRPEGKDHHLTIIDDGVGGVIGAANGTGSRLIKSLSSQLKGKLRVSIDEKTGGRKVDIIFPRVPVIALAA